MSDDDSVVDRARDVAQEQVTLSRGQYVLLLVSAGTGVISALAHGLEFLHEIGIL